MQISETDIDKYQSLCKSFCNKNIDRAKAREELSKLVQITAIILRSEEHEKN